MENRGTYLALLLCLIAMPAEARFRNPFSKPPASASTAQKSGELPFRLVHSSLVVATGSLNGVPAHNLLIDTGTNPTVLDVAVARKLGVQGKTSDLRTLGGGIPGVTGIVSSIGLGPILAKSVPVFVADLSFMKQDLGERIDAVIGLDVLKASSFTIDYEARRIVFGPPRRYPNWVPFAGGPPMITVQMQVQGEIKRLLVDTGAEGLFLFEGEKSETAAATTRNGSHFSLSRNREPVEIPDVRLGSLRRSRQPAYMVHTQDPSLREFDGLLGLSALGIKQVVFDFERKQLGWR